MDKEYLNKEWTRLLNMNLLDHNDFSLSSDAKALLRTWENYKQKVDRPSWDEFFIEEAFRISQRSLDAQTKHGCVLVKNNIPICCGYNSFIREIDDTVLPNMRGPTSNGFKYDWMVHSETNMIYNCARLGKSTLGGTVYITGEPCLNCYQAMYQAGISEIVHAQINRANMIAVDKEYAAKVEIFKYLTEGKLKIRTIDIDTKWLDSLSVKIKGMKNI